MFNQQLFIEFLLCARPNGAAKMFQHDRIYLTGPHYLLGTNQGLDFGMVESYPSVSLSVKTENLKSLLPVLKVSDGFQAPLLFYIILGIF